MINLNKNQFDVRCRPSVEELYQLLSRSLCRTASERDTAFAAFEMKMVSGMTFRTSVEISQADLTVAEAVIEWMGPEESHLQEIRELTYRVFADFVLDEIDPTNEQYVEGFFQALVDYSQRDYHFVGPCDLFEFAQGTQSLLSDAISIVEATQFLAKSDVPRAGTNWELRAGEGFDSFVGGNVHVTTIGGTVWNISTGCPKGNVFEEARWMADVFVSAIRLGLRQADYCHRPTFGQLESGPFETTLRTAYGMIYSASGLLVRSDKSLGKYKVDKRFCDEFHGEVFQDKLRLLFFAEPKSLGKNLYNGLGWLSRGRQSADNSERILYFFTALEALLTSNDQTSPISDTIARFVSVIVTNDVAERVNVYGIMKKLYGLRSKLVHKGSRSAHLLNANNVQYFAELCFSVVFDKLELSQLHKEFLDDLRAATHGGKWPNGDIRA